MNEDKTDMDPLTCALIGAAAALLAVFIKEPAENLYKILRLRHKSVIITDNMFSVAQKALKTENNAITFKYRGITYTWFDLKDIEKFTKPSNILESSNIRLRFRLKCQPLHLTKVKISSEQWQESFNAMIRKQINSVALEDIEIVP